MLLPHCLLRSLVVYPSILHLLSVALIHVKRGMSNEKHHGTTFTRHCWHFPPEAVTQPSVLWFFFRYTRTEVGLKSMLKFQERVFKLFLSPRLPSPTLVLMTILEPNILLFITENKYLFSEVLALHSTERHLKARPCSLEMVAELRVSKSHTPLAPARRRAWSHSEGWAALCTPN